MADITTALQVCNLGLSYLKIPAVDSITVLTAPSKEVKEVCAQWYDLSRQEALRAHPWNFAKARAQLAIHTSDPDFGYENQYVLPTDFSRLRFIGSNNYGLVGLDYDIEGAYLLYDGGDETTLNVGYIKDEEDVSLFDPLFVTYLALIFAKNICYGVTGKTTLRRDIREMLLETGNQARAINGQDKPPRRVTKSNVLGARRKFAGGSSQVTDPKYISF